MAAVAEQNTYPKITPADLRDPTLFRLQTMLDFLYSQIDQTQTKVTAIQKQSISISGGSGGSVTPATPNLTYYTVTLTANATTLPGIAATAGSFIAVVIFEDGTGGWTQTWPAEFVGMAAYIQATDPNTFTSALFYTPDGTNFQLIGAPVTGAI